MTIPTRWRKLLRDFDAVQGRILMTIAAIAAGVYAVAVIASAYAILTREITRNYVATNPASALIDLGSVDPALVEAVRRKPAIAAAEAASIVTARVEIRPNEWARLLLFVIPDFETLAVNKVFPQDGAYPPKPGTIALERSSLAFLGAKTGGAIKIQTPTGPKLSVTVSGVVHDPSLAPSWQEQTVYGYLTPETLTGLGGVPTLELLKVVVKDALSNQRKVDDAAADLAMELRAQGLSVHQMQVPPTGRHPHQTQMTAILVMFLIFAVLALALSAILTASIIDGLLARQIRQIAVMKAIGARSRQIAGLYLSAVLAIAGVAVLIGLSLGALSGRRFAGVIAGLLNFDIASYDLPLWMIVTLAAGGLGVPVVFALIPIRKAARITIREAISDYGVSRKTFGSDRLGMRPDMRPDMGLNIALMRLAGFDRTLILAMRNAFRRRGRLALTLTLLAAAGAMFLASLSVKNAWDAFITASAQDRGYDLELRFDRPAPTDAVLAAAAAAPGVSKVEPWSVTFTAAARPDGLTVVRTYPDGGHANLEFRSLPAPDRLSHLVFLEGRAPEPGDDGAVLINQGAWSLLGRPRVGDTVALTVEGRAAFYRLAGVVRQIVTLPTVFAPAASYQRATRTEGKTNAIRAVTTNHDAAGISAAASAIETRLQSLGVRVTLSMSETQFGGAVSGHVRILVVSLMVMSGLMAVVGLLGLASAQGTSVAERTREFGVMRAIGGVNAVIIRNIIVEGVFIGLISIVFAGLLALPFAWGIGALVGTLSFGLPLPLTLSLPALGLWLGVVICGTIAASLVPARNAAKLTIRETLAYS